jgi:hypothetical protein
MLKRILIAIAVLCGMISAASAEDSATWGVVRGWTIGVDRTIGNGCFIYAPFEDGLFFRLGFNPNEDNAYVVFGNTAWRSIEVGRIYPLELQMGRKPKWSGKATGSRLNELPALIVTSDDDNFVVEIASQNYLRAWFGSNEIANISLKGTMAAIQEMIKCQKAMSKRSGSGADPFAD